MSEQNVNRRNFLKQSALASAGTTLGVSFEEKALAQQLDMPSASNPAPQVHTDFPMGTPGNLKISRLICGGNLISGFAHSRD